MDKTKFIVHSVGKVPVEVPAMTDDGRTVTGIIDGLVVELVPMDGFHGTITCRYLPSNEEQMNALLDLYKPNGRVLVTTETDPDQPAEPSPRQANHVVIKAEPKEAKPEPEVVVHAPAGVPSVATATNRRPGQPKE